MKLKEQSEHKDKTVQADNSCLTSYRTCNKLDWTIFEWQTTDYHNWKCDGYELTFFNSTLLIWNPYKYSDHLLLSQIFWQIFNQVYSLRMISNEVIYFRLANNIENDPQSFSHQQSRKPVTFSIFKNDYSSDSCVCQFIHIYTPGKNKLDSVFWAYCYFRYIL
jgi:hypothetical protein